MEQDIPDEQVPDEPPGYEPPPGYDIEPPIIGVPDTTVLFPPGGN